MNYGHISKTLVLFLATVSFSALANTTSESRISLDDAKPVKNFPGLSMNAQFGMNSFEATGKDSKSGASSESTASLTFDIGDGTRTVETGLMFFKTTTKTKNFDITSDYIAIPLNAKIYRKNKNKGFYGKFGALTAFQTDSTQKNETKRLDIIGNVGIGNKFTLNKRSQIIVEGTYNYGFLDTLQSTGTTRNEGFMITTGVAFDI